MAEFETIPIYWYDTLEGGVHPLDVHVSCWIDWTFSQPRHQVGALIGLAGHFAKGDWYIDFDDSFQGNGADSVGIALIFHVCILFFVYWLCVRRACWVGLLLLLVRRDTLVERQ